MRRQVLPEILDSLPPNDPAALHNRRDLRLTNRIMGNDRWWLRTLPTLLAEGETALEIGAGAGELGLRLAARGIAIDGLDLWPRPADWPARQAWHQADLQHFADYSHYAAVFGNMIFHQFAEDELRALGDRLRGTARVILACEPARRRLSQVIFARVGPLLGANYVSLHDAKVSITAGFRDDELPAMLGLRAPGWDINCVSTPRGAYRMIAVRRS